MTVPLDPRHPVGPQMTYRLVLCTALAAALFLPGQAVAADKPRRPNVLLVLTDDMDCRAAGGQKKLWFFPDNVGYCAFAA